MISVFLTSVNFTHWCTNRTRQYWANFVNRRKSLTLGLRVCLHVTFFSPCSLFFSVLFIIHTIAIGIMLKNNGDNNVQGLKTLYVNKFKDLQRQNRSFQAISVKDKKHLYRRNCQVLFGSHARNISYRWVMCTEQAFVNKSGSSSTRRTGREMHKALWMWKLVYSGSCYFVYWDNTI